MPGKNRPTKIIRKKAYEDVYINKGKPYNESMNTYETEAHRDLYERVYYQVYNMYWRFESTIADMNEIFTAK